MKFGTKKEKIIALFFSVIVVVTIILVTFAEARQYIYFESMPGLFSSGSENGGGNGGEIGFYQ